MSDLRRCGRCGELNPVSNFAWRRRERGQRHNYCRPCHTDYRREHYLANRQRYIDMAGERSRRVREERFRYLMEYFSRNPCVDCEEPDPLVLEFDHLEDKLFDISQGIGDRPWQDVLDEMEKCDVVCSNCHRRRTARRAKSLRYRLALELDPDREESDDDDDPNL